MSNEFETKFFNGIKDLELSPQSCIFCKNTFEIKHLAHSMKVPPELRTSSMHSPRSEWLQLILLQDKLCRRESTGLL